MFTPQFIELLQQNLRATLPGQEAQYRMAPRPRTGRLPYDHSPETARRSGVLILFYPNTNANASSNLEDAIYLPLILRPTYEGVHSGQVGFPGGGWEEGDADLVATALREAQEEIGVVPEDVRVIGQLSPLYVFASNHLVHPTVAWINHRPHFQPDPREVAQLLEVPLHALLDPTNQRVEQWQLRDRNAEVPFYYIQEQTIWGATAMMLSELLTLPAVAELARSAVVRK
ncbi:MAG: CoA pyrophosphatase [Caldilineaceae bacterium]|nr:CoA pyrophosphatase [Caldilineaceae bacterium]